MRTYSEFRPTAMDSHYTVEEMEDWLVVLDQNRDSDSVTRSNFQAALDQLGGEGDSIRVDRFGHWACGWFELITVKPNTPEHNKALEIEASLKDYPILDECEWSDMVCKEVDDYFGSMPDWEIEEYMEDQNLESSEEVWDYLFENWDC